MNPSTTSSRLGWRRSSASSASTGVDPCPSGRLPSHRAATTPDLDQEIRDQLTPLEQARRIAHLAEEKLARDVVILDMRPVVTYTDYFVICSGQSPRQTKAIYDQVYETLKREDRLIPRHVSGEREATWILADYLDVILHVFTPEARGYYRLEQLWGDVPSVELAVG